MARIPSPRDDDTPVDSTPSAPTSPTDSTPADPRSPTDSGDTATSPAPRDSTDSADTPIRGTAPALTSAALCVVLLAMGALTVLSLTTVGFFDPNDAGGIVWYTVALWVLFAVAVLLLRKVPRRAAIVLIVAGSAVLSGAALAGQPNTSTDSARYAFDGMVQDGIAADGSRITGVSPYAAVPADDVLAPFRTSWLFQAPVDDSSGHPQCADTERLSRALTLPSFEVICTAINRPQVHTIYPPAAELYFAAVRFFVGADAEYWPFQLTGAALSIAITVVLVVALLRRRMDARWAALWAWSPFVATEAVTNSHVDALAALLLLLATLCAATARARSRARPIAAGILLGLSIAVKLIPVIGAPALLRRHPLRVAAPAVLTFAALYVPYVAATGLGVIGFLPGYLAEEGYDDGSRFALVSLIAPGGAAVVLAAVLLAITAVLVWRRTDPAAPWHGQVIMIGTTLLIVTPHYSWYALLLVPFVALSARWEWLAVPAAMTAGLLVPTVAVSAAAFLLALLIVLVGQAYRTYLRRTYRYGAGDDRRGAILVG